MPRPDAPLTGTQAHAHFLTGQQMEQERIIKLLEEWGEVAGCYCCASDAAAADIIACIKGEKKVNE